MQQAEPSPRLSCKHVRYSGGVLSAGDCALNGTETEAICGPRAPCHYRVKKGDYLALVRLHSLHPVTTPTTKPRCKLWRVPAVHRGRQRVARSAA